ncbi:MAG: hypothetical protein WCB23_14650 [Pseudolabrys sp.]
MADQQAGSPNTREVEYWNSAQTRAWRANASSSFSVTEKCDLMSTGGPQGAVWSAISELTCPRKALWVDNLGHPIRLNGVQLGASLAGKLSSELISIASRDGSGE